MCLEVAKPIDLAEQLAIGFCCPGAFHAIVDHT